MANRSENYVLSPVSPQASYQEDGLYSIGIRGFHDNSSPLSHPTGRVLNKDGFDSLDALVQAAYQDRLERLGHPAISSPSPDKQKYYISHSTTNQYDLVCRPIPEEGLLQKLGVETCPDDLLSTQHVTLKNGFNGNRYKVYLDEDNDEYVEVDLEYAISGSWDRESESLQMARRIGPLNDGKADCETPSDCYIGRVENTKKALEQAKMIFLAELHAKQHGKGLIREETGVDGIPTYTLQYVVNSLQSTSPLYSLGAPFNVEQEQRYVAQEAETLKNLSKSSHLVVCPKTKQQYRVRLRPILFSRQVNVFANLEKMLPGSLSGETASLALTRQGWRELKKIAQQKLPSLNTQDAELVHYLIQQLDQSINQSFLQPQMSAANELVLRDMLCKLLSLPIVYHCKSSTDRTSAAIAMSSALRQWKELGLEYPSHFEELVEDERFHELFMINWFAEHQISRNARAPNGFIQVEGKEKILDHERLGISVNDAFAQCGLFPKLMPKRYRKAYGLNALLQLQNLAIIVSWIVLAPLINLFVAAMNPYELIEAPENFALYLILAPFAFLLTYFKSLLKAWLSPFYFFPKEIIDIHNLEKPERRLFTGTEYQKNHIHSLERLLSHALNWDEYQVHFESHFNNPIRKTRELVHANLIEASSIKKLKNTDGTWNKALVLNQLATALASKAHFSINGKLYFGIEQKAHLLKRLQELNGSGYEAKDSLLHQAWIAHQDGSGTKEAYLELAKERDHIHSCLTQASPSVFRSDSNATLAELLYQELLQANNGEKQQALRQITTFRKGILAYARMRTKARVLPSESAVKMHMQWIGTPIISLNTQNQTVETYEEATIRSEENPAYQKTLQVTTLISINTGQADIRWSILGA